MEISLTQKRLWAIINLDNATHNFNLIKHPLCCVVKANAYGHGAVPLAKLYEKLGAVFLAVSNIEEAIQLRNSGIKKPIIILGYTPVECAKILYKYNIDQAVYNYQYAEELNKKCISEGIVINIHLKIDTGMGRIGFQYHHKHNELGSALSVCGFSNLNHVGIFTHFSNSDSISDDYTKKQFNCFREAVDFFKSNNIIFKYIHCSNSAALINYPQYCCDMVRAGLVLYGIAPVCKTSFDLKPVLSLYSVVSNVKKINKGDSISYGKTFIAKKDIVVATLPIGYADGFWRSNQNGFVYLNNKRCKIIGRVCMDQIMVECDNANIGDLAEIYGEHISIYEAAERNNTIPYEILCSISARVPRVYIKKGKIVEIIDKILD